MGRGRLPVLLLVAGLAGAGVAALVACDDTAPTSTKGTGDNLIVDVDATVQPDQPPAHPEGGLGYGYSDGAYGYGDGGYGSLDVYVPLD
jgi:hypothetical protein